MPRHTDEARVGTQVNAYRLTRVAGRGGMGTVYEGVHTWTERRVAVKFLRPELAEDPEVSRRFLREARAAASLHHPNVVDVLDMGTADGAIYLVLEYLEGESLQEVLRRRRKLTLDRTLSFLLPIMDALSVAHSRNIVHRDIKPDNIFLSRSSSGLIVPKLLDFGVAKLENRQSGAGTQVGALVGTAAYMAPEQVSDNRQVGPRTDIWAMGVVAYECLTGELPFDATSVAQMLVEIATKAPIPIDRRDPYIPPRLTSAIGRALCREISGRFSTMAEFSAALRSLATPVSQSELEPVASNSLPVASPRTLFDATGDTEITPSSDSLEEQPVSEPLPSLGFREESLRVSTLQPSSALRPESEPASRRRRLAPVIVATSAAAVVGSLWFLGAGVIGKHAPHSDADDLASSTASLAPTPEGTGAITRIPSAAVPVASAEPRVIPVPAASAEAALELEPEPAPIPRQRRTAKVVTHEVPKPTAAPEPSPEPSSTLNRNAAGSTLTYLAQVAADRCSPSGSTRSGTAIVTFAPNGRVSAVEVAGPLSGTSSGHCIANTLRLATIPPFQGAPVSLQQAVTLRDQ